MTPRAPGSPARAARDGVGVIQTVALYARVSTLDKGQDPEMQLRELRAHAQAQGLVVVEEFVDHGVSGAKDSRPALNRMMQGAQASPPKFDAVLVWKLDRFSRSLRHLINSLAVLNEHQVAFISLRDNLDLSTPAGRLMFQMIGAFAEFEREITRERVRAGLRNAVAKGRRLGRKARVGIDLERVRALRTNGASWRAIERELGIPQSTLRARCAAIPPGDQVCS
jgi:DNA invertase Pin-like site-specific DNA recombinase